ncbi:hypothetical protein BK816_01580 [Boudabousia tangfeifanii]|uniref:Uncharacterized protein n=1 Tax=Boudabousia tangfeifanii TaxID=1912795 RepID=A0A1D9MIM0_9ACTO|nr:hypothetical protein [Boudabousia tangfeifanii]AOZ72147.1 hypothetical protein BK816_01580 [Boudabousia tangfeifanii]
MSKRKYNHKGQEKKSGSSMLRVALIAILLAVGVIVFSTHKDSWFGPKDKGIQPPITSSTDPFRQQFLNESLENLSQQEFYQETLRMAKLIAGGDFKTLQQEYLLEPQEAELLANDPRTRDFFSGYDLVEPSENSPIPEPYRMDIHSYYGKYSGLPRFHKTLHFEAKDISRKPMMVTLSLLRQGGKWKILSLGELNNLRVVLPYQVPKDLTMHVRAGDHAFSFPASRGMILGNSRRQSVTFWTLPETYDLSLSAADGLVEVPETGSFNWFEKTFTQWQPKLDYRPTPDFMDKFYEFINPRAVKFLADKYQRSGVKLVPVKATKKTLRIEQMSPRGDTWQVKGKVEVETNSGIDFYNFDEPFLQIDKNGVREVNGK